ncbi:hypothetical protein KSS87_008776 [Heliosperma pusillum]|nr:hypothetical protein KSS87_008776 [Heliosperma pusillum]
MRVKNNIFNLFFFISTSPKLMSSCSFFANTTLPNLLKVKSGQELLRTKEFFSRDLNGW